jgi:hypothetical protein
MVMIGGSTHCRCFLAHVRSGDSIRRALAHDNTISPYLSKKIHSISTNNGQLAVLHDSNASNKFSIIKHFTLFYNYYQII